VPHGKPTSLHVRGDLSNAGIAGLHNIRDSLLRNGRSKDRHVFRIAHAANELDLVPLSPKEGGHEPRACPAIAGEGLLPWKVSIFSMTTALPAKTWELEKGKK
jgi:hypothetical protein